MSILIQSISLESKIFVGIIWIQIPTNKSIYQQKWLKLDMALSAAKVKALKATSSPVKYADGGGLFLLVQPNGSKYWRLAYRFAGKQKTLSLGVFPAIGLGEARELRDAAKKSLANNLDPGIEKQLKKTAQKIANENSFEAIAREWYVRFSPKWVPSHGERIIRRFERDIFPTVGNMAISNMKAPDLLVVLRKIEGRGAIETAHRALQNCGQVFRYAIATGRAERDIAADLRGALAPAIEKHHPTIVDPKAIGSLLRAIDGYDGSLITKSALVLAPLLFVRPGELRHAEWAEINLEKAEWILPAEKMKMNARHIVPLSTQAIHILESLVPLSGNGKYLFPSIRTSERPMSENTVNAALRRLGYEKDEMTGHGFRSMASTLLNEQGWNRDAIERQLAHAERDSIRAAYNYAEHLPQRREMMQAWADYLDNLRNS